MSKKSSLFDDLKAKKPAEVEAMYDEGVEPLTELERPLLTCT